MSGAVRAEALRVVPVTSESALAARAGDWAALLSRSESNRPTQAPFWLMAWWRVFGARQGRRIASALLYDGDRLVGLAPLLHRLCWYRNAIPFRRLELLATGEKEEDEIVSDYVGVIAERGYEDAVAGALAKAIAGGVLGPCDEIVLPALNGELPLNKAIARALAAQGMSVTEQSPTPSPYIRLPATWEAFLAGLSGSGRYLINRSLRDFEKWAGKDAAYGRVTSTADLVEGKKILVKLHEQRWQAAGHAGVFASRLFSSFHDAVLPALLEQNALELTWLSVKGEPVAVAYNIVWDNKVLFYQGGRTLDVPKGVRPGIVLHAHSIRAAIQAGRTEYDFLPGDSQYKMQLATASRPMMHLRAGRAPLRDLACQAIERGAVFVRERRARAQQPQPPQPPPTEATSARAE